MVPKAITLTLVSFAKENLQKELLQELYKPEVLSDLLKESEYVVSRRKECISMVAALNKAEEYVFPFHIFVWELMNCLLLGSCLVFNRLTIHTRLCFLPLSIQVFLFS